MLFAFSFFAPLHRYVVFFCLGHLQLTGSIGDFSFINRIGSDITLVVLFAFCTTFFVVLAPAELLQWHTAQQPINTASAIEYAGHRAGAGHADKGTPLHQSARSPTSILTS